MNTKTIFFRTNLNNKLHSATMIHLDKAPWASMPESVLANTIIEIRTQDNSYPPSRWVLDDLASAPFARMSKAITWQSHGMTVTDCLAYLREVHPDINGETPMAIYFYKKISD